jgi:uncharacterized protein YkwD
VHRSKLPTLMILLALGACDDATTPESDRPYDDEATEDAGAKGDAALAVDADPATAARGDAGSRRDAGRNVESDAKVPSVKDAAPTSDAGTAPASSGEIVPAGDHCAPVANFDAQAAAFEEEVLKLTNEARAVGHDCGEKGIFGPTTPLKMQAQLRCSSRMHSKYMAESGEFDHRVPAGSDPFIRMMAAGYKFSTAGENIAAGQPTPKAVVDGWLKSDGHCANIMNPDFTEIGVGYVPVPGKPAAGRYGSYWTQNFGKPRK